MVNQKNFRSKIEEVQQVQKERACDFWEAVEIVDNRKQREFMDTLIEEHNELLKKYAELETRVKQIELQNLPLAPLPDFNRSTRMPWDDGIFAGGVDGQA